MNGPTGDRRIRNFAPAFCVLIHVAALAAMATLLGGGMLTDPDVALRARYIADHSLGWTIGWGIWMLAGLSIVIFYAWWAAHLPGATAKIGVLIAAAGMLCDWTGESISAIAIVESASSPDAGFKSFLAEERSATLLTAGAANFLYTLGGMLLMFATPDLPTWIRTAMWATWSAGLAMSISAVDGFIPGIAATTVILFPLLILWVGWMGLRWRST